MECVRHGDGDEGLKKKAMWLYPKVMGNFNPSERWGHSSCYFNGFLYVYGGCCGGLHFSDVLVLNLDTMAWSNLATTGTGPGPRDSHSAVVVAHMMIVFGGTNGSKKVNDVHILDLLTLEWSQPNCKGIAPSPRESHTATVIGQDRMVIFGGSGEGDANYLNDLHVLDIKSMRWTSPEAKAQGHVPLPRDSHSAVAIDNKVFVYGGDCGDRYEGDVDVLDVDTITWSRCEVQGPSPGGRAGHASVAIGTKVYVMGGVGDKQYYNDVWALDTSTSSWSQLEIQGQQPQGRFSHTAIVTDSDIAVYGGCGEDERPLNEILILQLGAEHPNGRYNISMCKIFGTHCNQQKRRFVQQQQQNIHTKATFLSGVVDISTTGAREQESQSTPFNSDPMHSKRRRMSNSKSCELMESEPEEHSLSLSQHSSPSHSDQERTPVNSQRLTFFKQQKQVPTNSKQIPGSQSNPITIVNRSSQDKHCYQEQLVNRQKSQSNGHGPRVLRQDAQFPIAEQRYFEPLQVQNLIGADVHGKIDGAFDSGYLMTATVNGRIFRGVLFPPGPEVVSRGTFLGQNRSSPTSHIGQTNRAFVRNSHHSRIGGHAPETSHHGYNQAHRLSPAVRPVVEPKLQNELHGVVLTLGGPGTGLGGS